MARGHWRNNKLEEEKVINRIDRARQNMGGPQGSQFDQAVKKRLHECRTGDWIKQVLAGADNFGPLMRVIDPKTGLLENRSGIRGHLPPRAQVMVQP